MGVTSLSIYEEQAKVEINELTKVDNQFHKPRFDKFLEWINLVQPSTLIDIGCSWGYVLEMIPKSIKSIGIDISPTKT